MHLIERYRLIDGETAAKAVPAVPRPGATKSIPMPKKRGCKLSSP